MQKIFIPIILLGLIMVALIIFSPNHQSDTEQQNELTDANSTTSPSETTITSPLFINELRTRDFPGGDFIIEEQLASGTNYRQYITSYLSEGLKIYGLLTVPMAPKPASGFPAVLFVHGYIPPKQYSTTGNYPTYQATLARGGFITFKPDLRGHGNSEGESVSAHYSEKYVIDTLSALSYLKKYPDVDPARLGYWGHSNGGEIGLRVAVISSDIKAASFWAGVVGSYEDMFETHNDKIPFLKNDNNILTNQYGLPSSKSEFWLKADPYYFLEDIKAPIELQHGTADDSVPVELSLSLKTALEKLNKPVIYYEYPNDDHNIAANSRQAWQRTIDFFKTNL